MLTEKATRLETEFREVTKIEHELFANVLQLYSEQVAVFHNLKTILHGFVNCIDSYVQAREDDIIQYINNYVTSELETLVQREGQLRKDLEKEFLDKVVLLAQNR